MDLYFEIAGSQILGAREYQEDAFLTTYLDDVDGSAKSAMLAVIADGMGGHAAGNIAANLVVSTFNASVTKGLGKNELPTLLRESLLTANNALKEATRETPALDGMGCTMVSVAAAKGKLWWISVGDSHLYLLRDRKLDKKNENHSYGGYLDRLKAQGLELEPDPALARNMLMSAITGEEIAEIDCPPEPLELRAGDRLVMASDGLDTLSPGAIIQFCAWSQSPKECVEALLKAVEDAGRSRQDNTTILVIDVLQRERSLDKQAPAADGISKSSGGLLLGKDQSATSASQAAARSLATEQRSQEIAGTKGKRTGQRTFAVAATISFLLVGVASFWLDHSDHQTSDQETTAIHIPKRIPESAPTGTEEPPPIWATPASPPPQERIAAGAKKSTRASELEPAPESDSPQMSIDSREPVAAPKLLSLANLRDPLAAGGSGPLMIALPGGTFQMGSSNLSIMAEERPQHAVTLKPFAISKHEITVAEFARFAQQTGRHMPAGMPKDKGPYPITGVSWEDALAYTRWLSQETGQRYRLPSEAEWEYAASAGTETPYWWGFKVGQNQAHCQKCDTGLDTERPTQIGRFKANPFGLHDTAGNAAEWVHDCYHESYDGAPSDGRVWEGGDCTYRVVRGGSFHSPPPAIRSRARGKRRPHAGYDTVGIRVVRDMGVSPSR